MYEANQGSERKLIWIGQYCGEKYPCYARQCAVKTSPDLHGNVGCSLPSLPPFWMPLWHTQRIRRNAAGVRKNSIR